MKKGFAVLCVSISMFVQGQSKTFTVTGKINGLDSKEMSLLIDDKTSPGGYRRENIPVTNGTFSYTAEINDVAYMTIWPNVKRTVKKIKSGGSFPAKSSQFHCFVSPGAKIIFKGEITDFVNAYPTGDKTNKSFAKLLRQINPLQNRSLNAEVKMADNAISDSVIMHNLQDSVNIWDEEVISIKKDFLKKNPASIAAIWLLSDMIIRSQLTDSESIAFFKNMDKTKLVAVPYYQAVAKRVDGMSATLTGKKVPGVESKNTYDGSNFNLSSLQGKYVVLDFWGTWCGPCVSGMPKMKTYRDKYKGKLEIVGIASESDNGERWIKFLTNHSEYNWPQVLSKKNEEDFILKFNVAGFPTKIIVGPDGLIVNRYVGEDDEIYKKLDELLSGGN